MEAFLDRVTTTDQKIKITLSMWHRIIFLLTFTIAGLLYLMAYYLTPTSKVIIVGVVKC